MTVLQIFFFLHTFFHLLDLWFFNRLGCSLRFFFCKLTAQNFTELKIIAREMGEQRAQLGNCFSFFQRLDILFKISHPPFQDVSLFSLE